MAGAFTVNAQEKKTYKPVVKSIHKILDLESEKKLYDLKKMLLEADFKDVTQIIKPSINNVCILENIANGASIIIELYFLPDQRIYEIGIRIDGDKELRYGIDVKMFAQKIGFNNVSKKMVQELGMPNISVMDWDDPYSSKDWDDDTKTAKALMTNKLFIFFGFVSSEYENTEFENEASIYLSIDPLLRINVGVKDVELYKLLKTK